MKRVLALAKITCLEGLRGRALMGVLILFLFALGLNLTAAGFFVRGIAVFSVNLLLATISIAGLLMVLFICAGLMTKDIEKKTIQIFLTRPLTRSEYIWGKYFGLVGLLFSATVTLIVLSLFYLSLLKQVFPEGFEDFLWTNFVLAGLFHFVKVSVLAAVLVLWGSLASSSFIMMMLTVGVYVIGTTLEDVRLFLRSAPGAAGTNSAPSQVFDTLSYVFPNLSAFDFQFFAAYGHLFPYSQAGLTLLYAVGYVVVILSLASVIFSRREFN